MKQIIFKAKSIENGEWVYGNYVHSKRFEGCPNEHRIIDIETGLQTDVDCDTVCQFICEYDKKNEMIFEGDIVKTDEAGWAGKVVFEKDIFYISDDDGGYSYFPNWGKCKIIGNVFDNKELLKI